MSKEVIEVAPATEYVKITENGFTIYTEIMQIGKWFGFIYKGEEYAIRKREDGSLELALVSEIDAQAS